MPFYHRFYIRVRVRRKQVLNPVFLPAFACLTVCERRAPNTLAIVFMMSNGLMAARCVWVCGARSGQRWRASERRFSFFDTYRFKAIVCGAFHIKYRSLLRSYLTVLKTYMFIFFDLILFEFLLNQ